MISGGGSIAGNASEGDARLMSKWVYDFAEGSREMRELLGGKGAGIAEMTRVLGAERVPAGFTVTTEACVEYMRADQQEPEGMAEQVAEAIARLEQHAGKRLGDPSDPLLVSVRSGARESMPGMMDSVLNLGMGDEAAAGVAEATGNERFAWDSYRRFVQMFGNVVRGIPGDRFEDAIQEAKDARGVKLDTELDVDALKQLTGTFKRIYREHTGEEFPSGPQEQLRFAIRAVFDSWMGDRAVAYRRMNHIPHDWGTAVNVQQMVFGNKGDSSGSGVAFSRDEVTGGPEPSGDFLPNAQGEDVVSGVRTPRDIAEMKDWLPDAHAELMESIGKLAIGQERYYEQQVAQGLDDYFTGRGESPGRWLGRGAAALGLRGTVEDGELSMLIAGRDPRTGRTLREQPVKVAALDLTFSAPKSVSVLHAVADERVSAALVACHEEAVAAALGYLEETAVFVSRRTGAGLTLREGGGFVTAAFRHRMSRALDPQLHTHCVSANMARGNDGRWTAVHHPSLFRAAQTAGYLYQAHMRALVCERLGLEWGQVRKGAAELAAINRDVLEEFSRRRHEMRRAAEAGGIGLGSKAASQAAALATRSRKQYGIETGFWREEVQARAAEHGLDRDARARVERVALNTFEHGPRRQLVEDPDSGREVADRLAGPLGLTELQNTFDHRAVLRAVAEEAQQGARVGLLVERGRRFAGRQDVLRTERGELTTAELVAGERRLIAAAQGRASEGVGRVDRQVAERAIEQCPQALNDGQRKAVEATVSSGHGVQVIEALAGSGKTYTAGALRHVYQQAGYPVVGVAPTGRAVRELVEEARIPSQTLDLLLLSLDRGHALPTGGVVVLDEAGMAPTRQTARLFEAAQQSGCKVVAIGDPGQLHSVQAGGWMRAVGRKVGALRLSDVVRQRDPLERRALAALHDGAARPWLEWAREHHRVELGTADRLLDGAVSEWHAAATTHDLAGAVLIARDNDTRRGLNDRARELVRQHGGLGTDRSYGPVQIAVGDRVICRRNDRRADVDNGTRGTVRAADDAGVMIETDRGGLRRLAPEYVAEHLEHAYALTGHGMQGGTVERAFVVAALHELTKGWSYTALSRATGPTRLFVISDSQKRERDELAPGERRDRLTDRELHVRLQRYMQTRDDEDLAIEQLRSPAAATVRAPRNDLDKAADAVAHEDAAAERLDAPVPARASIEALRDADQQVTALQARLDALAIPDVKRLEAAERREQDLTGDREELLDRLRQIPPPPKLPFASDRRAHERHNLRQALEAVDRELTGVRTLRTRLVGEVGEPDQIHLERGRSETALLRARSERDRLRDELVAAELASQPRWAVAALGGRPNTGRERDLWDRAARGLARYRLEHDVTDEHHALGDRPGDPPAAERYERAQAKLEEVRHELGLHVPDEKTPAGETRLPAEYARLFGTERTPALEQALAAARNEVQHVTDEQLRRSAYTNRVLADLDRRAAHQATRLEQEYAHHTESARNQTARAAELETHAATLGRRHRHEREQLRHDAALQRQHAERHASDAGRIELELQRLRAAGRHPDEWLKHHAHDLVMQLAAEAELERRREQHIADQLERAVAHPPEHVRNAIGERPISDPALADQWERLTRRIERHRLTHGLDVDRDGTLGPDPSHLGKDQRAAYEEHRRALAQDIARYRESRELPPLDQAHDLTRDDLHGAGRSL
jgi:conjugative relaxase-like TrwC/TraI family protein